MRTTICLALLLLLAATLPANAQDKLTEGYADSNDVKIHYVTQGTGPLVVLIHGFPDFWYSWRDQMPALAKHFQVVAIDQRGYNKSDQPKGVENYTVEKLVGDVAAVLKHFKRDKAVIVGHDWGGLVAWSFAMTHPDRTDRLIVLNLPHPKGMQRELANNPNQQKASQYARNIQEKDLSNFFTPQVLAFWVKEPQARAEYVEAFKRSSVEGMLNYYKANYPRPPYRDDKTFPPVKCPVLMIHGLKDPYILAGALNDNWKWVEKDLTLVTVPQAGHFVHRDEPALVTRTMLRWLTDAGK
jgi:pimeloyl-ACP methyl ester carboxylesterase